MQESELDRFLLNLRESCRRLRATLSKELEWETELEPLEVEEAVREAKESLFRCRILDNKAMSSTAEWFRD